MVITDYKYHVSESESGEKEVYRIRLEYDPDPENPREFEHPGSMYCCGGYGDPIADGKSLRGSDFTEALKGKLLADLGLGFGDLARYFEETGRLREENGEWVLHETDCKVYSSSERKEWLEEDMVELIRVAEIRELANGRLIILSLYMYEHGGVTISTAPFSCPWDSGMCGYIYTTTEKTREYFGLAEDVPDADVREKAEETLRAEVDEYDDYLTGNVYQGVLERYADGAWEAEEYANGYYPTDGQDSDAILEDIASGCFGMDFTDECPELPDTSRQALRRYGFGTR